MSSHNSTAYADLSRMMVTIRTEVPGEYFFGKVQKKAQELNVFGWCMNHDYCLVKVCLEGKRMDVDALFLWLSKGPVGSCARSVECLADHYKGEFDDFLFFE